MHSDTYEIKNTYGHYTLYVNGKFYGSYDTAVEAAKEIDKLSEERKTANSVA